MRMRLFVVLEVCFLALPTALAQKGSALVAIDCRVMEVFTAKQAGATVVIFHQRDKADAPRLSELLKARAGTEAEFETRDGRKHRATVMRMKTCFGRGLLVFAAGEAKLTEKDDFVLRFPEGN